MDIDHFWNFENDENKQLQNECRKTISKIDKYGKLYMIYYLVAIITLIILSVFSDRHGLYYCYIPESIGETPIWFIQLSTYPALIAVVFMFDYLIFNMLQLVIMQIQLLKSDISTVNFKEHNNYVQMKHIITKYHQHHMFLIR